MPPVVVAFPTASRGWAATSTSTRRPLGAWADYLTGEMLPRSRGGSACGGARAARRVRQELRRLRRHRARARPCRRVGGARPAIPAIWAFELCYLPDMPDVLRAAGQRRRSVEGWWTGIRGGAQEARIRAPRRCVNILAMAASYDPDPSQFLGLRLPVTADTCEIIAGALGQLAGARSGEHALEGHRPTASGA